MPVLRLVGCVACPKLKEYINIVNCEKCPLHIDRAGVEVKCGYTFKQVEEEPSRVGEPYSRW